MSKELKWCGYCQSWHSKPCGEGCCWSPSDPTIDQIKTRSDLMKLHDDTMKIVKDWVEGPVGGSPRE